MINLFKKGLFGSSAKEKPSETPPTNLQQINYESFVGQNAVSLTPLRRTGIIEVNGRKYEAQSATNRFIEKCKRVRVIGVIFKNRLLVVAL